MSFSREAVLSALGQAFTEGMKITELAKELDVRKKDKAGLRRLLASMVEDGVIERVGGVMLIVVGVMIFTDNFFLFQRWLSFLNRFAL